MCEAAMLAKLLGKMEAEKTDQKQGEGEGVQEPPQKRQRVGSSEDTLPTSSSNSGPSNGSDFKQLTEQVDLEAELPPGCRLGVYQGSGSPYVQGQLPVGCKHRGRNTHSRSFDIEGKGSSNPKRAHLTEQAAKAQVVSWLWGWWNSKEGSAGA